MTFAPLLRFPGTTEFIHDCDVALQPVDRGAYQDLLISCLSAQINIEPNRSPEEDTDYGVR